MDNIFNVLNRDLYKISPEEAYSTSNPIPPSAVGSGASVDQKNQYVGALISGKQDFSNSVSGYILGVDEGVPKFYIGDTSNYLNWTGTELIVSGNISATTGTIGGFTIAADALYAGSGSSRIQLDTTSGIHLGATSFGSAPFSVSLTGSLVATSATINGTIRTSSSSTRVELNAAANALYVYDSGVIRLALSDTGIFFNTVSGASSGSLNGFGTNDVVLTVASSSLVYHFNTSYFYADGSSEPDLGTNSDRWERLYVNSISLNGDVESSWPEEFSGDWSDISIDTNKSFSSYSISGLGTVESVFGDFNILTATTYFETNDIYAESGSTIEVHDHLDLGSRDIDCGDIVASTLSAGSGTIRAGGYHYFNSGNNNVYIYSTGSNLSFKDSTGTYASIGAIKSAIVPTSEGHNALYCIESPEVWFMDFCENKDSVDTLFLQVTVAPYKFIQCDDGTYQIWGKRKGHEEKRFENKTEDEFMANERFLNMNKPNNSVY